MAKPGRPSKRDQRRASMLSAAVELMRQSALGGLYDFLNVTAVAARGGVPVSSTSRGPDDRDWSSPDELVLRLASTRLFDPKSSELDSVFNGVVTSYNRRGTPQAQFVAAIAADFERIVGLKTTVPTWQLHMVAATGHSGDGEAADPAYRATLGTLTELRQQYFRTVAERYTSVFRTALLDMGRKPREGFSEETILHLVHTFLNGAIVRHLIDPDIFTDTPQTVGLALLAMVEGLTEPDEPRVHPDKDLAAWVAHESIRLAEEAAAAGDWPDGIVARLHAEAEAMVAEVDSHRLRAVFAVSYPLPGDLWDAAMRYQLERRVAEVARGRRTNPGRVLAKIVEDVLRACEHQPAVAQRWWATRRELSGVSYLDHLEPLLRELAAEVGLPNPDYNAGLAVEECVTGNRRSLAGRVPGVAPPAG